MTYERLKMHRHDTHNVFKCVVYDSNPKQFLSDSVNISSRSASFLFCKRETSRVSRVEPPAQDVKYRRFNRVSTKHLGIICHNSCSCTGHTNAVCYSREDHWREGCISVCHRCAIWAHMIYCDVLWRIDGVWTSYRFTWRGCAFVLVGTGWNQWGMDHILLCYHPTTDSLRGRSRYEIKRQLRTLTPVPLTSWSYVGVT